MFSKPMGPKVLIFCALVAIASPALAQSFQSTPPRQVPPGGLPGAGKPDGQFGMGNPVVPNILCPATIRGQVKDKTTVPVRPLAGMTMQLRGRKGAIASAVTNAAGWFEFKNVCKGDYGISPRVSRHRNVDLAFVDWRAWHPQTELVSVGTKPISGVSMALQPENTFVMFGVRDPATGVADPDISLTMQRRAPDGNSFGPFTVHGNGSGLYAQCCGRHSYIFSHPEYRFTNLTLDIQPGMGEQVIFLERQPPR